MPASEEQLKARFKKMDKDESGFITEAELKLCLAELPGGRRSEEAQAKLEERMLALLKATDLNGDGMTTEKEFIASYMKIQEAKDDE